jgi:phosphoribosylanthranilate isomerase
MGVTVKICGINSPEALRAAAEAGAEFVGLVFYPPSPRHVTIEQAAALAALVPAGVLKVGLFVDADDAAIARVLERVPLDLLQLHGRETAERVREVRERFGLPVMKAIPVASPQDVETAREFEGVADRLLFDAKPPKTMEEALPGGNALRFDWELLRGRRWKVAWMLSGGLLASNLAEAVGITGARAVDVSSGVEDRPGHKDPARIRAFLAAAKRL